MINNKLNIDEIIIRYLDGTATDSDKEQLLTWLKESDKNLHSYSEFRDVWFASQSNSSVHSDMEKALKRLEKRIKGKESEKKINIVSPYNFYKTARVAAFFALLFIIGITFYHIGRNVTKKDILILNHLITDSGSKRRFVLPDSTIVWLNSNSKLEYPTTFSESSREISLEGEAYFEVARDEDRPFVVRTENLTVKVLGTEFNINAHSSEKVQTVLVKGRVEAETAGRQKVVLQPGELAESGRSQIRVSKVNVRKYTAWREGMFYFEEATLEEILQELCDWYYVQVVFTNPSARMRKFSGILERNDDLEKVLKKIELTTSVRFTVQKGMIKVE